MHEKNNLASVLSRPATRRRVIKAGGLAALGLAFGKPAIEILRPGVAFASNGYAIEPGLETIQIEAENMQLDGYVVQSNAPYIIRLPGISVGSATAPFPGPSGTYRVDVEVVAEWDGQPILELWIGGVLKKTWKYPLASPPYPPYHEFITLEGPTVILSEGVEIKLIGKKNAGAWARVDRITLTPFV